MTGTLRGVSNKHCLLSFFFHFDWILFIFAGNEDIYKSLNEFVYLQEMRTYIRA